MKYDVLATPDLEELCKWVNEKLKQGWQIQGGISHGDSSTHIAYIHRGKVFSHRFHYSDPDRYIPTEEVRKILKELRKPKL